MAISSKHKKFIRNAVYLGLLLFTLVFVAQRLNFSQFQLVLGLIPPTQLFGSALLFAAGYFSLAWSWTVILSLFQPINSTHTPSINLSFWGSQVFKYLPSNLFTFASRIIFTRALGLPTKPVVKALFIEAGSQIYTGILVWLLLIHPAWGLVGLVLSVTGIALAITFYHHVARLPIVKTLIPDPVVVQAQWWKIYVVLILAMAGWGLSGLGLAVFAQAMGFSGDVFALVGYNASSFAASILAVFAPAGVGVKEYVLSFAGLSTNIILNWRVFTVILDVVFSMVAIGAFSVINRIRPVSHLPQTKV